MGNLSGLTIYVTCMPRLSNRRAPRRYRVMRIVFLTYSTSTKICDIPTGATQQRWELRICQIFKQSVMNHLVNHRMSERQQMRWSPEGAHYLLQVRTELLNVTLPARYRILYPGFHRASEYVDLVARRTPPNLRNTN